MNLLSKKEQSACVIGEPWFTGLRDLGELKFELGKRTSLCFIDYIV
jgi:hypothetical protein